ncbi:hypothetical protein E2C01_059665 [Portunus trituberculatus]|uniref:Uncharacterized protein n=1 Tax=Portunus trituberculatus TaxID=210409 RepID=A0A5B7H6U1_PORTR|nr:hypothetical protein [Portunus trituberculatus]
MPETQVSERVQYCTVARWFCGIPVVDGPGFDH